MKQSRFVSDVRCVTDGTTFGIWESPAHSTVVHYTPGHLISAEEIRDTCEFNLRAQGVILAQGAADMTVDLSLYLSDFYDDPRSPVGQPATAAVVIFTKRCVITNAGAGGVDGRWVLDLNTAITGIGTVDSSVTTALNFNETYSGSFLVNPHCGAEGATTAGTTQRFDLLHLGTADLSANVRNKRLTFAFSKLDHAGAFICQSGIWTPRPNPIRDY